MRQKIVCSTRFDITATGVRGNYSQGRLPFVNAQGQQICTESQWQVSRNKQRNWETLLQLISLRTLPEEIQEPVMKEDENHRTWSFDFYINAVEDLDDVNGTLGALISDCRDVPMITGLDEDSDVEPMLLVGKNINFKLDLHK